MADGGDGDGGGCRGGCDCDCELLLEVPFGTSGICTLECEGVGGPDDEGERGSVTQSLAIVSYCCFSFRFVGTDRCDLVATTLATVCARVEPGCTWNTGNESLPSTNPRVDRITEMKWVQVLRSRGSEEDRVRSCHLSAY